MNHSSVEVVAEPENSLEKWGWVVKPYGKSNSPVGIYYSPNGYESFGDALRQIDSKSEIKIIRFGIGGYLRNRISNDSEIQKDIYTYLNNNYTKEFSEALKSSRNMHNPKMIALHDGFSESLLASNYVLSIDKQLKSIGHEVGDVSFEKFVIFKSSDEKVLAMEKLFGKLENGISFNALVWLEVKPVEN